MTFFKIVLYEIFELIFAGDHINQHNLTGSSFIKTVLKFLLLYNA